MHRPTQLTGYPQNLANILYVTPTTHTAETNVLYMTSFEENLPNHRIKQGRPHKDLPDEPTIPISLLLHYSQSLTYYKHIHCLPNNSFSGPANTEIYPVCQQLHWITLYLGPTTPSHFTQCALLETHQGQR